MEPWMLLIDWLGEEDGGDLILLQDSIDDDILRADNEANESLVRTNSILNYCEFGSGTKFFLDHCDDRALMNFLGKRINSRVDNIKKLQSLDLDQ